jgi:nucleoside-diphosphate-sugar epimerase
MKTLLVTGGAGFLGSLLLKRLTGDGHRCVSIDLHPHEFGHPLLTTVQGDIRDAGTLEQIFSGHKFDGILHCAAILAHGVQDQNFLWTSNVDGTRRVAEAAIRYGVPRLVFTSSNCLWGESLGRPVCEQETPNPVELYGQSKLEGEKILNERRGELDSIILRCPTIIDSGRLGLLTILFEFIDDGRKVWTVGGGRNKYQFIYAQDLVDACLLCLDHDRGDTFHVGSDDVKSIREVYSHVIRKAGSKSTIADLPEQPALFAMRLAHSLRISPLGPYHYKMIAEDFSFDTNKIKGTLGWRPTLTNEEMLWRAYEYYSDNRHEIEARKNVSAHRKAANMGVIRLLKWVS